MGKKKKQEKPQALPRCECDEKKRCVCGNRPDRPSHGHIWNREEQKWTGRGAKEARVAKKLTDSGPQTTTMGAVASWQRMPSTLLKEWCQRNQRPAPKYSMVATGRARCVVRDTKVKDKDLIFCPKETWPHDDFAHEAAALLALHHVQGTLPLERKLPDPFKDLWLSLQGEPQTEKGTLPSTVTSDRKYVSKFEADAARQEMTAQRNASQAKRDAQRRANPHAKVFMSKRVRRDICDILGVVAPTGDDDDDDVDMEALDEASADVQAAARYVVSLGFPPGKVLAACRALANTGDVDQILSWLVLHTDEASLPETFDPSGDNLDMVRPTPRRKVDVPTTAEEARKAWGQVETDDVTGEDDLEALIATTDLVRSDLDGFGVVLASETTLLLVPNKGHPVCVDRRDSRTFVGDAETALYDLVEMVKAPASLPQTTKKRTVPEKQPRNPLPSKKQRPRRTWWDAAATSKPPAPRRSAIITAQRARLPAVEAEKAIRDALSARVVLVEAGTGAGKTTQVPQFLLDTGTKIVVAQPRRLAAVGVAHRVAEERGEQIGSTVGFAVRGQVSMGPETALLFCTTGVLLQRMRTDPMLETLSHVVVDEVHERGVDTDLLLALLKRVLLQRTKLKVILMSATVDAEKFLAYFSNFEPKHVKIPGITYPVDVFYKNDLLRELPLPENVQLKGPDLLRLAGEVVRAVARRDFEKKEGGAVLVFVAGLADVSRVCRDLDKDDLVYPLPLHGSLAAKDQRRCFDPGPPGRVKVIVATNIAETSVTIPDVTVVVDCLLAKMTGFDADRDLPSLKEQLIARDAADQRKGRAGRVRSGECFRLIDRSAYDGLKAHTLPEIFRVSLEGIAMQTLAMDIQPKDLDLVDAVPNASFEVALTSLRDIGALREEDDGYHLTALGKHLAALPCAARVGKLLILGSALSPATRETSLTIAAALGGPGTSLFRSSPEVRDLVNATKQKLRKDHGTGRSDHALLALAFDACDRGRNRKQVDAMGLSWTAVVDMRALRSQLDAALTDRGFGASAAEGEIPFEGPGLWRAQRAIIAAALYPRILKIERPAQRYAETRGGTVAIDARAVELKFKRLQDTSRVFLHPASVAFPERSWPSPWVVFNDIVQTDTKTLIRDVTEAAPYALLLFGGHLRPRPSQKLIDVLHGTSVMSFSANPRVAAIVDHLRSHLDALLLAKADDPRVPTADAPVVNAIIRLLLFDGMT